jgi:tetratricopeptide (TPR) repeat protein
MKSRFVVVALTIGACLVAAEALAQRGVARGKVVDENGQAVPGASVTLEFRGGYTLDYQAETDDDGQYKLIVTPGPYEIIVAKEGYQGASLQHTIEQRTRGAVPDVRIVRRETAAAAAVEAHEVLGPLKRAMELTQAGRLEEAEAEYKKVLAEDPSMVEARYNLGTIYLGRKNYAAAEHEFQKIIELSPDTEEAYPALSRVYAEQGDDERALEVMTQGAALKPEDARIQLNLGVLYYNAQRMEEAEEILHKVEALDPENVRVQYMLGTIAVSRGDVEDATARLERYLAGAPENSPYRETAKNLLEQLRDKDRPES